MSLRNGRISYDETAIRVLIRMREALSDLPATNPTRLRFAHQIRLELDNAREKERRLARKSMTSTSSLRAALRRG